MTTKTVTKPAPKEAIHVTQFPPAKDENTEAKETVTNSLESRIAALEKNHTNLVARLHKKIAFL